jgi:hypothetical protein
MCSATTPAHGKPSVSQVEDWLSVGALLPLASLHKWGLIAAVATESGFAACSRLLLFFKAFKAVKRLEGNACLRPNRGIASSPCSVGSFSHGLQPP